MTESRAHDASHELVSRGGQALTYDSRGNVLTDDRGNVYAWDVENRLQSITPATVSEGAQRVTFAYDTQWRRVAKVVSYRDGDHWEPLVTHQFLYDGWNLITEITDLVPAYQIDTSTYVWGEDVSGTLQGAGGIGGLICASFNGTTAFYHYQANGNVMALTDATGALAASYAYTPYGALLAATGPLAAVNPMRFSTKYTDDETGLLYYGYRYYDAGVGRWLSNDPIGISGGLNMYGFCGNNPCLLYTSPSPRD